MNDEYKSIEALIFILVVGGVVLEGDIKLDSRDKHTKKIMQHITETMEDNKFRKKIRKIVKDMKKTVCEKDE